MTSQGNGQSRPYQVKMSEQVRGNLRQIFVERVQFGKAHEFLATLR
jgi:hypothetical protein